MKWFISRRLWLIGLLGFSSGLPLALSGTALQAWFAAENIKITTIGLLTLIGQPYVYKFLWAPLLDRYIPPWLGRRRGWIAAMQLLLAVTLILMSFGNPHIAPGALAGLALMLAIFSATQDTAIDAYRTDILLPPERGLGASLAVVGYRIAMIVSGGMALILAQYYGWRATYLFMALLMLVNMGVTFMATEPAAIATPLSLRVAVVQPFLNFLTRHHAAPILLFIVLYKLGEAYMISLSSAFLIQYLHFSLAVVGSVNKIVALTAAILGGLLGGVVLMRWRLFPVLFTFGIAQALCGFLFMALAIVGKNLILLIITVFADYFLSGLTGAALVAFITGLCDKRFSATQFALFSAITAIGRVFIGPLAGVIAQHWGWVNFFLLSVFLSLPGLGLLWRLRYRYDVSLLI